MEAPELAPPDTTAPGSANEAEAPPPSGLSAWAEASLLWAVLGAALGHFAWTAVSPNAMFAYVLRNELAAPSRARLLGALASGAAVALATGWTAFWLWRGGTVQRLRRAAVRLSPWAVLGTVPLLFNWTLWRGNELAGLVLLAVTSLLLEFAVKRSLDTGPAVLPVRVASAVQRLSARTGLLLARPWAPLAVVGVAALGYAIFFSVFTLRVHYRFGTAAFDLGIENNLVWNASHLGPLFKASPLGDADARHTGYHQTFFAYVIALPYRLWPTPQFLLVLQAIFIAAAAVPLFLWAKLRVSPWTAALVALAYLVYPPLHGANLYDFHYQPLAPVFVWTVLLLLERGRWWWAALGVLLTLSLREDLGLMLAVMGGLLLFLRRRPLAGVVLAAVGFLVFVVQKGIIMPRFLDGTEAYAYMYQGLIPAGEQGFSGVLKTVFANPAFTLSRLLERGKLLYVLHLFAPLVFLPLRRAIGWWLCLPGFFFTLLATGYDPLSQISFQYTTYWTMFLLPALVLALEKTPRAGRRGTMAALVFASIAATYVYGGLLQQNLVRGGWKQHRFVLLETDHQRHRDAAKLMAMIPPEARVTGSEYLNPHLSSRPNAYALRWSLYDAEWVLFEPARMHTFEKEVLRPPLERGEVGVFSMQGDFVLLKRGADPGANAALLLRVGR